MENTPTLPDLSSDDAKVREMQKGANWFYWVAILAVVSTLLIYFYNFSTYLIGLGVNEYVDARFASDGDTQRWAGLALNVAFAGMLALFGYFARKGNDMAFILGIFLYFVDAVILLGYRELFAFSFHLVALFFIGKGLLASRRRYDPSVDATGA